MVDAEDYLPVGQTYPEHPIRKNSPTSKTLTELIQNRKNIEK
jgi:hypothetical protein